LLLPYWTRRSGNYLVSRELIVILLEGAKDGKHSNELYAIRTLNPPDDPLMLGETWMMCKPILHLSNEFPTGSQTFSQTLSDKLFGRNYSMNQQFFDNAQNGNIKINAKPQPVTIDAARTAVIVVDMQNDFGSPGGMFDRAGLDISMIQKAVGPTAQVLASARAVGIKIVYLKAAFRPDLSDLGGPDSPSRMFIPGIGQTVRAPDGTESRILIRDTWNTDIVPELEPQRDDLIIYKHRFSGFYQTDLDATLKQMGVKYLIITGCTTSVCVESTVRDAMFRDYLCVLLADCMAEVVGQELPRSNHEATLWLVQGRFGWVSDSEELIKSIETLSMTAVQKHL
jgi:ureidoacrylate peracid hydrolase